MDFTLLEHVDFNPGSSNGTFGVPSSIMEALIPGYRIFSRLFFQVFGFDIGLIISSCLIIFAISQGIQVIYLQAHSYFLAHFTSTIYIDERDDLYDLMIEWLASECVVTAGRSLKAVSSKGSKNEDDQDEEGVDAYGIFSYEEWANKLALRFEPWYGIYTFSFEGRCFTLKRQQPDKQNEDSNHLTIRCAGRSYETLKALLHHVRLWSRSRGAEMIVIWRAKVPPSWYYWTRQALRPARSLNTISLGEQSKVRIVKDINEYLHPATARWYAARGIPYRRGYLLHGPPGTGKTSMSFALAGFFGLPLYCISLNELNMTESSLNAFFSGLPERCIVLLEDIDTAGLRREDLPSESVAVDQDSSSANPGDDSNAGPTKSNKSKSQPIRGSSSGISLSGLLNTIDGAASHEGRVLIMTTNCPESLDDALIRPGRVDLQIAFTHATQEQARDIFTHMYSTENEEKINTNKHDSSNASSLAPNFPSDKAKAAKRGGESFLKKIARQPNLQVTEPEKLAEMASSFAVQIPEGKFTPAEIQGFLLNLKQEPLKAVEEVGKWRDALLEAKKKGKNVVNDH